MSTVRLPAPRPPFGPTRPTPRPVIPPIGSAPRRVPRLGGSSGQASVELVAALPVVLLIVLVAWQTVLAGQTFWNAHVASRAAARAHAVGADARQAARGHLPRELERGLRVTAEASGDVRVSIRVPSVLPAVRLGRIGATSYFRPQS